MSGAILAIPHMTSWHARGRLLLLLLPPPPPPPPIGRSGIVARSATAGTDLSIGDVVSPNLCDHEVYTSVVFGAGG
jgi:hypothetical protein